MHDLNFDRVRELPAAELQPIQPAPADDGRRAGHVLPAAEHGRLRLVQPVQPTPAELPELSKLPREQ